MKSAKPPLTQPATPTEPKAHSRNSSAKGSILGNNSRAASKGKMSVNFAEFDVNSMSPEKKTVVPKEAQARRQSLKKKKASTANSDLANEIQGVAGLSKTGSTKGKKVVSATASIAMQKAMIAKLNEKEPVKTTDAI